MVDAVHDQSRIGVCLDTCHMFAAGYDISTKDGYMAVMAQFGDIVGWQYLKGESLVLSSGQCLPYRPTCIAFWLRASRSPFQHGTASDMQSGSGALQSDIREQRPRVIAGMHVNDSKAALGSKRDRHENIGRGLIGIGLFECLMNDPRLDGMSSQKLA